MPFEPKHPGLTQREGKVLESDLIRPFVQGREIVTAGQAVRIEGEPGGHMARLYHSFWKLQDERDYRQALQDWFSALQVADLLLVIVPHSFLYDRQLALPSRLRPQQLRLYSPALLLSEVEEALVPNSYRVRLLGDLDDGFDYAADPQTKPQGMSDIALVLERISSPSWSLAPSPIARPWQSIQAERPSFEPARTRVKRDGKPSIGRILIMKLDHLGDIIMGLPALRRARDYFPEARIDLLVGSWNAGMASGLDVADRVLSFDAFPRNSTEEEPNVDATVGMFKSTVVDEYDLAIDLRADIDTRVLLRAVKAPLKAGIGTRARFPFLDIALPLDSTRNEAERVRDEKIEHWGFAHQGSLRRTHFGLHSDKAVIERDCGVIWGPYIALEPGDYIFDFYIDMEGDRGDGLLHLDIALHRGVRVAEMFISGPGSFRLPFRVDVPGTVFEARVFTVEDRPSISFSFYGGRLVKRGPANVLHQSEYAALLVELVRMRISDFGMPQDVA